MASLIQDGKIALRRLGLRVQWEGLKAKAIHGIGARPASIFIENLQQAIVHLFAHFLQSLLWPLIQKSKDFLAPANSSL